MPSFVQTSMTSPAPVAAPVTAPNDGQTVPCSSERTMLPVNGRGPSPCNRSPDPFDQNEPLRLPVIGYCAGEPLPKTAVPLPSTS